MRPSARAALPGPVEAAVLRAVVDGRTRPHRIAERLDPAVRTEMLHDALDRCRRVAGACGTVGSSPHTWHGC